MQKYSDIKHADRGHSHVSPIMEALNRGNSGGVSNFGSVTDFISGILGDNFLQKSLSEPNNNFNNYNPNNYNEEIQDEIKKETEQIKNQIEDFEEEEENEDQEELDLNSNDYYKIYRDKEEIFECNLSVQGAKLSSSQVRLIMDHDICNLVFYGKIYKEGKCKIPLKKIIFYPEGSMGRIRLEVVVDDSIFIPWEETFIVEGSKKVKVEIKPQQKRKIDFKF